MTVSIRVEVFCRDNWQCLRCGRRIGLGDSCHHRRLKSQGGPDDGVNRVTLCGSGTTGCHGWAHNQDRQAAERAGLIVPSWRDWAETPVLTFLGWVMLGPEFAMMPCPPPPGDDARNYERTPA